MNRELGQTTDEFRKLEIESLKFIKIFMYNN